jgi:glycosyltransferase involved in cell wall biosynthesis
MRIAVWHDAPPGGARRAMDELVRRLAARHQVVQYQLDRDDAHPAPGVARFETVPYPARRDRRLGLYWNDWLAFQDVVAMERLERELAARVDAEGYDVVLTSAMRSCVAPALPLYLATPTVHYCHEPPLRRLFEPRCRPAAAPLSAYERGRLLWRWPSRALLDRAIRRRDVARGRRATRLLANSRFTARRLEAVYGRPASVCYLGVDAERFLPADRPARDGVVSVGALEPHKGFDFVVRALGRVPAPRRPALTVVGSPGHPRMAAHLRALAARVGVDLTIRSATGVQAGGSDAVLSAVYRAHALFVFGSHLEPFGLVALEAMASGLPVVAVAEGGLPEVVRDGVDGCLRPRDEAAVAAAVEALLGDDQRRGEMSRAAREAALRWSWGAAAERLERHLRAVAGGALTETA